jgi:hypothetical protein
VTLITVSEKRRDIMATEEKVRNVFRYIKAEAVEIGDVPGHVLGVAEARGLAFPDNGEVAAYAVKVTFDYVNGTGPHRGYATATFEDGAMVAYRFEGTTEEVGGGKTSEFEGKYTYLKGTGRFEGIQGGGSYTGRRLTPLTEGADCYSDGIGSYTLP